MTHFPLVEAWVTGKHPADDGTFVTVAAAVFSVTAEVIAVSHFVFVVPLCLLVNRNLTEVSACLDGSDYVLLSTLLVSLSQFCATFITHLHQLFSYFVSFMYKVFKLSGPIF